MGCARVASLWNTGKRRNQSLAFWHFFHWDFSPLGKGNCLCIPLFYFLPFSLFLVCNNLANFLPPHSDMEPRFPFSGPVSQNQPPGAVLFSFLANERRLNERAHYWPCPSNWGEFFPPKVFSLHYSQELGLHTREDLFQAMISVDKRFFALQQLQEKMSHGQLLWTVVEGSQGLDAAGGKFRGQRNLLSKVSHLSVCSPSLLRC